MRALGSWAVRARRGGFARAFGETAAVVVATGIVLAELDRWDGVRLPQPAREVFTALALAAAGVAAAAAVVALVGPEPRRRLAAPLGLYGLVLGPVGIVEEPGAAIIVARFAVDGVFLLLLSGVLWQQRPVRWMAVVAALVVTVGVADAIEDGLTGAQPSRPVVVAGWWAVALALVVAGARRGDPATWRIGIGLSLVSMAHLEDFTSSGRISSPDLEFGALRLLGLLVVLVVLTDGAIKAVRSARQAASASAEREHEIRNALSGLSGVGYLLGSGTFTMTSQERAALGSAMQSELERMRTLLDDACAASASADTRLGPLLHSLVALRIAGGERIDLDVLGELRVGMPAHPLAQVLTNLLANCARHAAGSPVRIGASSDGEVVTITVADEGPGPRPWAVTAGSGIGLAVCARLLAGHRGTLRLASPGNGCTAEIRLPAVHALTTPVARLSGSG
jgi:two-component system OmpR family sensor kinase